MSRHQPRAPGSFSPLPGASSSNLAAAAAAAHTSRSASSNSSRGPTLPPIRAVSNRHAESDDSDEDEPETPSITITKTRQQAGSPATPIYSHFATAQPNASTSSLHQNFSRPAAGRTHTAHAGSSSPLMRHHARKHSATPGLFDSTLPSTTTSNLSQVGMSHASNSTTTLSASQIAAQAAVMSHQNSQQQLQQRAQQQQQQQQQQQSQQHQQQQQSQQHQQQQHSRQRSQTVPAPGEGLDGTRRGSDGKGPASPPMLSLTEASAPREPTGLGFHFGALQTDRLGHGGHHSSAATAAANVVFPRSGHSSPSHSSAQQQLPLPPPPPMPPEKLSKSEKAKAKLFSRPSKISIKTDSKEKPLPSPGKIGSALSALQRGNFSTTSLAEPSSQSIYNHSNSSAATIRPTESTNTDDKGKEKEKKHNFLSRQKHKLKDEYNLPLSSAASNSLPTDPNAPSSLYSFNIPASPGPSSSSFAKAKKDKKLAERAESRLAYSEDSTGYHADWTGAGSLPNLSQQTTMYDPVDPARLGLNQMSLDDAWPYLKAKLLVIFEGEDLRLPVEDFNRVVQMHIQYCIRMRSPNIMLEDLRDLLNMGFSSLDRTLRKTPEDRVIPRLVELWLVTFTSILPYIQSVFLPLDLEVSGCGTILTPEKARDFWGGVLASRPSDGPARLTPASTVLDVRRLVLIAYRDIVILPRYDNLRTIFSRLSLEFLPSSFATAPLSSPAMEPHMSTSPPDPFFAMARPGTAMSLDPSTASYNSTSTTLLGEGSGGSAGGRSRAISNVSFGSHGSDGVMRPFTPSSLQMLGSVREQNFEDSKQVTDMVGRMLQCMSVLSSLGALGDRDDDGNEKLMELCKLLKLNWLGRGRTGRNRMGIVGGRVRREGNNREEIRAA